MPLRDLQYPQHPYNTVKRYKDRGTYLIIPPFCLFPVLNPSTNLPYS